MRLGGTFIGTGGQRGAKRGKPALRRISLQPGSFHGKRSAGFTLLEMLIVIMIILILAGIAVGRYEKSVLRSKEAVLKQDLFVMRQAIQQYTLDKQTAPSSLDDLVTGKYMSGVPVDPITRAKDWHLDFDDVVLTPTQGTPGLDDVHSSSPDNSPNDGTPYNTW